MALCLCLGYASGLPYFVPASLIYFWLTEEGVSLTEIGFLTVASLPYTLKFLWAPLLERFYFELFGRRRSWMFISQAALTLIIVLMGTLDPQSDIQIIGLLLLLMAVFGATQDIAIDAYRRELLDTDGELGLGSSLFVQSYRFAIFVPKSLGIFLLARSSAEETFFVIGMFMAVTMLLTFLISEANKKPSVPQNLVEAVTLPFTEFFSRKTMGYAIGLLLFMSLYKLGDNMATALAVPFYSVLGFTNDQIAFVTPLASVSSLLVGGILGGLLIIWIGINRALWIFGAMQFITICGYVWLHENPGNILVLGIVLCADYLVMGVTTTAVLAYISRETSRYAVATQFALFTAITALPRVVASAVSGLIIETIGWVNFFYLSAILALPGLLLLVWIAPFNAEKNSVASSGKS